MASKQNPTGDEAAANAGNRPGALLIVGGAEDRKGDMDILTRFVDLCGGPDSAIVVLTAASSIPDEMWQVYDRAFGELGVRSRIAVSVDTADEANDPALAARVLAADGIFMSGGEQQRLLNLVGGSKIHAAMQQAFRQRGSCVAGTSAGASAISTHMLAHGTKDTIPDRHTAQLAQGLGFLQHVVIDQHFSERQRLARLLSAVAQNPTVIGMGIDEDTAVVIRGGEWLEVVGAGALTLVDGRQMTSNLREANAQQQLELINVKLHLLPAGSCYRLTGSGLPADDDGAPEALRDVLALVTGT